MGDGGRGAEKSGLDSSNPYSPLCKPGLASALKIQQKLSRREGGKDKCRDQEGIRT